MVKKIDSNQTWQPHRRGSDTVNFFGGLQFKGLKNPEKGGKK